MQLMDDPEKYIFAAKIIWITPKRAQSGRLAGVGLQMLGEEGEVVQRRIETFLAGSLTSDRGTHTM